MKVEYGRQLPFDKMLRVTPVDVVELLMPRSHSIPHTSRIFDILVLSHHTRSENYYISRI